ncbi:molybdopterin converting factor subunit 1 [Marinobacterium stanieri]|uniref:molybdopterin converting factor subunit 1 n=1 Tax=Marinobacterium stanieri TaxID=49186 RepID=UPI003A916D7D
MKVIYFARVREQLGVDEETLTCPAGVSTLAGLVDWLAAERGAPWDKVLQAPDLICAVNQEVVDRQVAVSDQDEVAFFPPVTGG